MCCSRSPPFLPAIHQRRRMNGAPGKVVVPIFSGLGASAAISEAWQKQSLSDSNSPSGSLLLQSCYHAFVKELASLPSKDLCLLGISLDDFPTPTSLLTHERNINHILLSHSFLFLSQALRWLSLNDPSQQDAFAQPFDVAVGCPSFSLGVLIAPVIASSTTPLDYLSSAVKAYKVTLWIGIRVHLHHHGDPSCIAPRDSSWSIVCTGISPLAAQQLIADFHAAVSNITPPTARSNIRSRTRSIPTYFHIFLTATLSSSAVTISGPPHVLAAFTKSYPDAFLVLPAHIYALHHAKPVHKGTREQVLCHIRVKFPTSDALKSQSSQLSLGPPSPPAPHLSLRKPPIGIRSLRRLLRG